MQHANRYAVALIEHGDDQLYVTGLTSDIQRLEEAGAIARAWDIKLDNGHRPYAVIKKRVNFDITEATSSDAKNALTQQLGKLFNLEFTGNLHDITRTYLVRPTPAFWADLFIVFADTDGVVKDINPNDYYAIYRGFIIQHISGVKFVRLESGAISSREFPALA